MELFDEEELLKPKKKLEIKPSAIILVAVIILSILCVITVVAIVYLRGTILTIMLDGNSASDLKEILIIEENNKVYMPIRRMAEYLGYESFNGDYITRSEDTTKCYIETEEELVSFSLNSNVLTKVVDGQTQQIKITEPIKEINGELCITAEGAQYALNFAFYYDVNENDIYIETIAYLYTAYTSKYQLLPIENETFANKTAILDGMIITKSSNNYYGVITVTGETLLEAKYDKIDYLRKTSDFLVESNGKKGIITQDKQTKIEPTYDSIIMVTNNNDIFYVVGKSNSYGLLDANGKTLIYPEYEQIGIDVTAYQQNGVTNGYILYDKMIPVKRNSKWALFDTTGNKITEFVYDSFGCASVSGVSTKTYGVIEVPEYDLIVGCQSAKYNLINVDGDESGFIFESVYITVSEGKNTYYAVINGQTKELISFLQGTNQ